MRVIRFFPESQVDLAWAYWAASGYRGAAARLAGDVRVRTGPTAVVHLYVTHAGGLLLRRPVAHVPKAPGDPPPQPDYWREGVVWLLGDSPPEAADPT